MTNGKIKGVRLTLAGTKPEKSLSQMKIGDKSTYMVPFLGLFIFTIFFEAHRAQAKLFFHVPSHRTFCKFPFPRYSGPQQM